MKHALLPVTLHSASRLGLALAGVCSLVAGIAILIVYRYYFNSGKLILENHDALFIFILVALFFVLTIVWLEAKSSAALSQIQLQNSHSVLVWRAVGANQQPVEATWLACQCAGPVCWLRLRLADAPQAWCTCTVWLLGNTAASDAMRRWRALRSLSSSAVTATTATAVTTGDRRA